MSNVTFSTEHDDLFDDLSAIDVERRARALRAKAMVDFFGNLRARTSRAFTGLRGFLEHRRLVSELSLLDDRLLADIGLSRDNLDTDLTRGRATGFFAAPMTGKALLFSTVARKVPANSDVDTRRHAA